MAAPMRKLSDRRWRLFACAWARWVPAARRGSSGEAIELAERFADGEATTHQLASARFGGRFQPGHAAWAVCWPPDEDGEQMARRAASWVMGHGFDDGVNRRPWPFEDDIFGGPAVIDPAWLAHESGQVARLARTIYDGRSWELMPILGDALEEAGCDDHAILTHCRGAAGHVRGCWVVDAILGRE